MPIVHPYLVHLAPFHSAPSGVPRISLLVLFFTTQITRSSSTMNVLTDPKFMAPDLYIQLPIGQPSGLKSNIIYECIIGSLY